MIRRETLVDVLLYPELHRTLQKMHFNAILGYIISNNQINAYSFCSLVWTMDSYNVRICSRIIILNIPHSRDDSQWKYIGNFKHPLAYLAKFVTRHFWKLPSIDQARITSLLCSWVTLFHAISKLIVYLPLQFQLQKLFSVLLIKTLLLTAVDTTYSAASAGDWLYSRCCWMAIVSEGPSIDFVQMPKQTCIFRIENLTVYKLFSVSNYVASLGKRSGIVSIIYQEE